MERNPLATAVILVRHLSVVLTPRAIVGILQKPKNIKKLKRWLKTEKSQVKILTNKTVKNAQNETVEQVRQNVCHVRNIDKTKMLRTPVVIAIDVLASRMPRTFGWLLIKKRILSILNEKSTKKLYLISPQYITSAGPTKPSPKLSKINETNIVVVVLVYAKIIHAITYGIWITSNPFFRPNISARNADKVLPIIWATNEMPSACSI